MTATSSTGDIAEKVLAILADAEAMAALSRTNPDLFFEQKDGIVQRLKELHADVRDGDDRSRDRRPARTSTFQAGRIVSRTGAVVVAEVRRARQVHAR